MDSDQKNLMASVSSDLSDAASVMDGTINDQIQIPVDEPYQEGSIGKTMKDLGQEAKTIYTKYGETFSESEEYEKFSLQRMDSLIKEALALEAELKRQKENLRQRLIMIMGNLRAND